MNVLIIAFILPLISADSVELRRTSSILLPTYDVNGNPEYTYDTGASEQMAYDDKEKILYVSGAGAFHVVDVSNVDDMIIKDRRIYPNSDLTDIEFCGDYVFFSLANETDDDSKEYGTVYVLRKYEADSINSLKVIHKIQVGSLPDMIKPTKDCQKVVVAIEAQAYGSADSFQDPKGGVGIIRFPNGVDNDYEYTELDFTKFNDKQEELEKEGVRFVYRENGNTFDRDIEPECISLNCDETLAYISLQENNAIAVVDLRKSEIDEIKGLGYKTWDEYTLDASDKDGGIHMINYDFIRSFYQPDAIKYQRWNDESIIITADEGDSKDYEKLNGFNEERRGKNFDDDELSDKIPQSIKSDLADDSRLGRLKFTNVDGLDSDGKYENLYSFGGRGFTIRKASDMSILYNSGDIIEKKMAELAPEIFNSDDDGEKSINEQIDKRSDNKGPESESLETGEIDGRLFIFVGNERPGTIAVFSVGDDFKETKFEHLYKNIKELDRPINDLYTERKISEIDPEDLKFVSASKSPNGKNILFVAGGTLSALEVDTDKSSTDSSEDDPALLHEGQEYAQEGNGLVVAGGKGLDQAGKRLDNKVDVHNDIKPDVSIGSTNNNNGNADVADNAALLYSLQGKEKTKKVDVQSDSDSSDE